MEPLKIQDNNVYDRGILSAIPNLTQRIADKTLKELEEEGVFVLPETLQTAEDITEEQMILQSVGEKYRTGNVMGFLGLGSERLVIASRFGSSEQDYFFQYLLQRVLELPHVVSLETEASLENQLYQLFLFLFPRYLRIAMRKGIFKTYVRNQYNDANVKGSIEVARHIQRNTPFVGKISYSQREYSRDNPVMELVRHTIEFIKKKRYGNQLLFSVKDEVQLVVQATPGFKAQDCMQVVKDNLQHVLHHAYYREYRQLQRLCLLILQQRQQQFGTGSRQIYGILFDGAWLWEEYVALLIRKWFYHPMNKTGKEPQWLFSGASSQKVGMIYPDFISHNHENRIVADAKYKPVNHIGNKDYLQILAYMFRFDAKRGYFLYPEAATTEAVQLWLNMGSTYEEDVQPRGDICVLKHGLHIPANVENYSDFAMKMQANEASFQQELLDHCGQQ